MAYHFCPRCRRANPGEAQFCHYDGAELRPVGGHAAFQGGEMGREFIFPTGRRCKTYDELVRGCSEEWNAAREMLRQGGLRQFLAGVGRMDLAMFAQQAANQSDLDIALDNFLAQLPTTDLPGPRLDLSPRRVSLGKLGLGESRQFQLTILNQGARLLHGTVQVEGGKWVSFMQGSNGTAVIKTGKQQQLALQVDTFGLIAGQTYTAKLVVITNGGAVEVPISMELVPTPFPKAPLQGALSPHDLATRMKEHAKVVSPLLEGGDIQRWFQANGWQYPVTGRTVRGVAGIQQFFEGLGLSKPPKLSVSHQDVRMVSVGGKPVKGFISVSTPAKKWVYAHVESDSPWLRVVTPDAGGAQQARIEFEAAAAGLEGGRQYVGKLTILANGNQRFVVTVTLDAKTLHVPVGRRLVKLALLGAATAFLIRFVISLPDPYARDWSAFGTWLRPATLENRLGIVANQDAAITKVLPKSPADRAGLQAEDKIVQVDNDRIAKTDNASAETALERAVRNAGAGKKPAAITVERAKEPPKTFEVTLDRSAPPDYVGRFTWVLAWLGFPLGAWLLWRRGGPMDALFGFVVGGATGLAATATLACVLKAIETPFSWVIPLELPGIAIIMWTFFGAGLMVAMGLLGKPGRKVAAVVSAPYAWMAQTLGMTGLAEFLAEG